MVSPAIQAKVGKMATLIVVTGLNGNRILFDRATIGLFGKIIERSDKPDEGEKRKIHSR
jgi:hypothetical protein